MSLFIKSSGTWHNTSNIKVKNSSGNWRLCKEIYVKKDNSWHPVLYKSGYWSSGINSAFTIPPGVYSLDVIVIGGGGGGGGCTGSGDNHSGGGGGTGGIHYATISVTPLEIISIAIGKGGERASTYFNGPKNVNSSNTSPHGGHGETSLIRRGSNVLVQATGGTGGAYSDGDTFGGYGGAGGSPDGVTGATGNTTRNGYPATPGAHLSAYPSYGYGGNSHSSSNWTPTAGKSGYVIITY